MNKSNYLVAFPDANNFGMTCREYIATHIAAAMAGSSYSAEDMTVNPQRIARAALATADALLEELSVDKS